MAHISPLGHPLLKFMMEHEGFQILGVGKDRTEPRVKWLLRIVWALRLDGLFLSRDSGKLYRLDETLSNEIIMGGNTLIMVGEKAA